MTSPLPDQVYSASKRLGTLATALGSQLPGISFFLGLAPPGFPAITLLTSGGTLAIFFLIFSKRQPDLNCVRNGARSIAVAIALAVAYGFLFPYVTVGPPGSRKEHSRYQVGFGLSTFSLTDGAQRVAKDQHLNTKEDLMLAFGAYNKDGDTALIWKSWSIFVAGALLCALFVATYYYWTSGLAWLACAIKGA